MGGPKGLTDIKVKRLKANATGYEEYSVDERRSGGKSTGRGLEFSKDDKVVALYVGDVKGKAEEHNKKFYTSRAQDILSEKEEEEPLKGWPESVTIPQTEGISKEQEIEWKCFWPVDFDYPEEIKKEKNEKKRKEKEEAYENQEFQKAKEIWKQNF